MLKRPALAALTVVTVALSVSVALGERVRPPDPAPYRKIPDLPDGTERQVVIKGQDRGPVFLYTGLLNGYDPAVDFEMIARLKPTHWRGGYWPYWYPREVTYEGRGTKWNDLRDSPVAVAGSLETMLRLRERGMTWQPVLYHQGPFYKKYRIPRDELDAYRAHMYMLVNHAHQMGAPIDYWEPWNEPAPGPYEGVKTPNGFWRGTWDEYLAVWDAAYDAIREAYPEAKVVGPSYGYGVVSDIDAFLSHCKERGQRVDVLSWHENQQGTKLDGFCHPDRAYENIMRIRGLVEADYADLGIKEYHVDEWGYKVEHTGPGTQIAFFYYFDLAGIDRAAKAIWHGEQLLNGLLVDPKTPRASYWAWVEYAKQQGGVRLVTETNDRLVVALASRNDRAREVRALVARSNGYSDKKEGFPTKVVFEDLPMDGAVKVTTLALAPLSGGAVREDELPSLTTERTLEVADGKLTLALEDLVEDDVRSIVIRPPAEVLYSEDFEGAADGQSILEAPLGWKRKTYIGANDVRIAVGTALTGLAMDGSTTAKDTMGVVYKPIDLKGTKAYRLYFRAIANTTAKAANNNAFGFGAADGTPVAYWHINFWSGNTWELHGPGDVREQLGSPLAGEIVECAIVVDESTGTFYGTVTHGGGTFVSRIYPIADAKIVSVFRMVDGRVEASGSNGDMDVDDIVVSVETDEWSRRVKEINSKVQERERTGKPKDAFDSFAREKDLHRQARKKAEDAAKAGTIRIDCGSAFAYTDPEGNGWFSDREYVEDSFGHIGGGMVRRGPIRIEGTDNPEICRTELWGQKSYHITLEKGKYLLRLHWAETYGLGPGGRTFDVVAEGKTILRDFDATREAGGVKKAVVKEVEVEVTDGVLDLEFPHKEGVTPMINGIEVIRK